VVVNPSSRTPEGWPDRCPVCGECVVIEPSLPTRDAPCPSCGCLLWFKSRLAADLAFVVPEAYLPDLCICTKRQAIQRMIDSLTETGALPAAVRGEVEHSVLNREYLSSTGIGRGFAVPHAKHAGLNRLIGCVARSTQGIDFDSLDGKPVHLIVLLLSSADRQGDYLRALAKISDWLGSEEPNLP